MLRKRTLDEEALRLEIDTLNQSQRAHQWLLFFGFCAVILVTTAIAFCTSREEHWWLTLLIISLIILGLWASLVVIVSALIIVRTKRRTKDILRRLVPFEQARKKEEQQRAEEEARRAEIERKRVQQEEKRQQAERERQAEIQRQLQAEKEQRKENERQAQRLYSMMEAIIKDASESHERLLGILSEIYALQQQTRVDFKDNAFAPFWDGVCNLAVKMEHFDTEMRTIARCHESFEQMYEKHSLLCYDYDANALRRELLRLITSIDPKTIHLITTRYRTVVRKGQTDFHFASIYEHYRTREVLVEGFRDLVNKLGDISRILVSVNTNLIEGFRELNICIGDLNESVVDGFEYLQICVQEQEEMTRRVIRDEGFKNRVFIAATATISEILAERRHKQQLASQDAIRSTIEEAQERTLHSLQESEAQEQERHQEIISEGERDRRLIKDIDMHLGGDEWWSN